MLEHHGFISIATVELLGFSGITLVSLLIIAGELSRGCSSIIEAELQSLSWSLKALRDLHIRRVIIESSCAGAREALLHPELFPLLQPLLVEISQCLMYFDEWSLEYVVPERNKIASLIAQSVTSGHRYQSYLASGGPAWLENSIREEASFVGL